MTEISQEALEQVLDAYNDPYLQKSLLATGSLKDLQIDRGRVRMHLRLPYPVARLKGGIGQVLKVALENVPGVEHAELEIDWQVAEGPRSASMATLPGVKNIIAVASGKGGVGKSTVTANLALAMAQEGARIGVLDADIYGPSQAMMLGVPEGQRPEVEEDKFFQPVEALGVQSMSMAYLVTDKTPMVWRGPMVSGALQQLLNQTRWRDLDYLLIDMPPGTGDIQLTLAQKVPVSAALVVTTPQNIALLDAQKGIEMFRKVDIPVLGVVENMSTHICSQCGHEETIFGSGGGAQIAEDYGVPLLGSLPLDAQIRQQADLGKPSVLAHEETEVSLRFVDIARKAMAALAVQASQTPQAPFIEISED